MFQHLNTEIMFLFFKFSIVLYVLNCFNNNYLKLEVMNTEKMFGLFKFCTVLLYGKFYLHYNSYK